MLSVGLGRYIVPILLPLWLGNAAQVAICLGADTPSIDLAQLRAFAIPRDSLGGQQMAHKVAFSKNGQLLACFCSTGGFPGVADVYLWNIATRRLVRHIRPLSEWKGIVLRPGGPIEFPYYFTTEPYARLCFRAPSGLEVQDDLTSSSRRLIRLEGLDGSAEIEQQGIYFSTDDKYVAAVRKDDKSINVWNMQSGNRVRTFALAHADTDVIRSMAFDATNRFLAAALDSEGGGDHSPPSNGGVIVWDMKVGKEALHTKGEYRVFQVAFSSKGDLICGEAGVHPNGQDAPGRIIIRKSGDDGDFDERLARPIFTPRGVWAIAIAPHVAILSGDSNGQVLAWDIETGRLLGVAKENGQAVLSLAVGHTGRLVASGDWDSVARLWRIADAQFPKR